MSVERIANESGFGSSEAFRHHFHTVLGTTPQRHRQEFYSSTSRM